MSKRRAPKPSSRWLRSSGIAHWQRLFALPSFASPGTRCF
jgi:hypothetical protein